MSTYKPLLTAFFFGGYIELVSIIPTNGINIYEIVKLILQIILAYIGYLQIKRNKNTKN